MVPIEVGGQTDNFIFDTGANLSTIIESQGQKLGLRIIDVPFDVGSITGGLVKAKIGVAKTLRFGNVELNNVAFIVFPDKALYIDQIKYQIKGIIGYPVINALREITITKDKQIFVPRKPSKLALNNLAMDGLTPLILGVHNGRKMTFSFDTGARKSSLYPPFFKAFEKEITSAGKQISTSITGAGGSRNVTAYKMENVLVEFGGKKPVFKSVEVYTQETTLNSRTLYGNIGRDMIDQHDKMTISFANMTVAFE
jgi:predicted aspartyl protease